ncbi:TonB-dependent siderophore receptor [Herbaspirillum sp. alder98]|uniref:TonB-dependent siderophore receptor n=1 Tax=Herbaspirillum sp. alder98 TaxID=2913096 RepID=UPI001CD85E3C|nr:TonB-dependent receptor [Herbaspirillum sp. alder98]MCA1326104.1 TonB-dependent receptor [Herbaspirillum sp. alder98]
MGQDKKQARRQRPAISTNQPRAIAIAARTLLCLGLAAGVASTLAVQDVYAQTAAAATRHELQLPPGSLDQTLNRFAGATGIELSVDGALTAGKTSAGLRGSFSVDEGFAEILKGQGLAAVRGSNGAYSLRRAQAAAPESAQALPTVSVTGETERSATTDQSGSYTTRALSMGKMNQSIRETPQSVTVVTRQQMDDQNLVQLDQVLAQATGFTRSQRNFGSHTFVVRGFAMDNYLVDGVAGAAYDPTGWFPMDMAVYDRVEILRGAAGMVVGAADPSGAVNLVRKRPRAEGHFDVTASIGSFNNTRTEIDAGGALNNEGTVRARLVAAYQDRQYFYDVTQSREPMLYGVVEADLSRDTKLAVGFRHQENTINGLWLFGLPRYSNGSALDVSRSTSLVQNWNLQTTNVNEFFADAEHKLGGDWKAKLTFNHSEGSLNQRLAIPRGAVNPATLAGSRFYTLYYKQLTLINDGVDANLSGSFQALGGTHQLMIGANASRIRTNGKTASTSSGSSSAINVFNNNPYAIAEPATAPAWTDDQDTRDERTGVYASTRLQLAEPLHLLLGGRLSWTKYQAVSRLTGRKTSDYQQDSEFTPYAGLVFDLNRQWSLYASYTDTFQPQSSYQTASGAALKPAVGTNYEAGIKGELDQGRLNFSAAVFSVRKDNIAVVDNANLGNCPSSLASTDCYINGSTYRSRGFETEISGELARGWNVAAGYTFVISHNDRGQSISAETPHHLLRLSTNYKLQGELSGWSVGGGVTAQTGYAFPADDDPTVTMGEGGRAVWDLNTSYRINRHWTAALNITNLFDKRYYSMVGTLARGNYYGEPRAATLILRGNF